MTLDEYLRAVGFAPLQATQIATAYAQAEDFSSWLETQNLPSAVGGICEEWRKQYSKRTGWAAATIVEPLAARSFCIYRVVGPDEATGRCWAAMRIPCHFPGPMDTTGADAPAEFAVIAAEQDPDTKLFKWVSLTPNMKATFGYVLEAAGIALDKWAIVREFDLLRGDRPEEGDEPEPEQPVALETPAEPDDEHR